MPDIDHQPSEATSDSSPTMAQSILRSMLGLGLFAVITAGLIALTQVTTHERITEQIKAARSKALLEITPAHDNDLIDDAFYLPQDLSLGLQEPAQAFIAKRNGESHTLILPVTAPEGYTAPIRLIVGINRDGVIQGVRVVEHRETPGLGDKIEVKKSDWIHSFEGQSLALGKQAWAVDKDGGQFDSLTGATITPRAVVKAVYQALLYFQQHQVALLNTAPGQIASTSTNADSEGQP